MQISFLLSFHSAIFLQLGYVILVDLMMQSVVSETNVNEHIINLVLVPNDSQSLTYALVSTLSYLAPQN